MTKLNRANEIKTPTNRLEQFCYSCFTANFGGENIFPCTSQAYHRMLGQMLLSGRRVRRELVVIADASRMNVKPYPWRICLDADYGYSVGNFRSTKKEKTKMQIKSTPPYPARTAMILPVWPIGLALVLGWVATEAWNYFTNNK